MRRLPDVEVDWDEYVARVNARRRVISTYEGPRVHARRAAEAPKPAPEARVRVEDLRHYVETLAAPSTLTGGEQ